MASHPKTPGPVGIRNFLVTFNWFWILLINHRQSCVDLWEWDLVIHFELQEGIPWWTWFQATPGPIHACYSYWAAEISSTKDRCHLHLHQLWFPSLNQLKAVALVHLHHHHHHKKPKRVMRFRIRVPSSTLSQLRQLTDLMTNNDPLPAHRCSHGVWMASHHHWCLHPHRLWVEWNAVYLYQQNCCAVKTW